jgi:hypothetical protein
MTRRRLGDRVVLPRVREERGLRTDTRQSSGQLRSESIEVVATELIDGDQDDQRRPRGWRLRLDRTWNAWGDREYRRANELDEFH